MKRLLLVLFAIFSLAGIQAQTYLNDGDYVTISFVANDFRYYLEASGDGILTKSYATDDCLWRLGVTQTGNYTLQDLTTERYLYGNFSDPSSSNYSLASQGTVFSFTDQGSVAGKYMYGHLYYSQYYQPWWMTINMYLDAEWLTNTPTFIGHSWTQYTLYIEKWEQKGAGKPTGHFNPSKIEFTYAESDAEAAAQARPVYFEIEATTESYYQCVPRPDEALLRRSTGDIDANQIQVTKIYWQSDSLSKSSLVSKLDKTNYVNCPETDKREVLSMSECTYNAQDKKWQFTITPEGASPMGLKDKLGTLERWIDYADNVVVEYTYGNSAAQTARMRVVRKAYHQEDLPPLTFSINPVTYTFSMDGEEKIFDVVASHQHGTVIYNVDNQVIKTEYEEGYPAKVNLMTANLEFNDTEASWLQANKNGESKIKVIAQKNEEQTKRSFTLIGSLKPLNHLDHSAVDFNIELHQRGMSGGIQFVKNAGQSGDALDDSGNQQVHTAERTIYYLPNKEIELRLPESGFSGYMRWYDYETGGDPYYNYAYGKDSTSWILSPRAANGRAFSAINTPKDGEPGTIIADGESHGLYAINQASGGILNEGDPYNPMPIIKGWNYDTNNPTSACHTMACDVSAYTDYQIVYNETTNTTRIDTIHEPTLSYRQLFHLRPASEMAKKIANLAEDQYLEEYHYTAPAGKQILLSTEHRYRKYRSHPSELCYFYKDVNGNLTMITAQTPVTWYEQTMDKDGNLSERTKIVLPTYSAEMDYLIVRYDEYPVTKVYTLVVDGGDEGWAWEKQELRIARFEVDFVDIEKYGPTSQTIMTKQRMTNEYEIRSLIDFNYPEKDYPNLDRVTSSDGSVHINQHLPWEQSTYGYVYPSGELATKFKRGADQGVFPFYGEYSIVNEVKKDWARAEQLGGKDKGFALYVDGTMEPGLVASIEANANICEGQTMYCSAWFCNPAPAGWSGEGNPIFRCNVEGLNDGIWTNIETYFVGELLKGSGWQQVVFPIKSDVSYEKVRVSIYNFATTNQGNDFMVDDICLYVSQLPIAAYRGEMACASNADHETQGIAVLRIDYNKMDESSAGYIYYQIFNETYTETIEGNTIIGKAVALGENNTGYYHDIQDVDHKEHTHAYGSIAIPDAGYTPKASEIRPSVTKFIDELVESGNIHDKAYIKATNDSIEKYLLYVAHVIPNTTDADKRLKALYDMDDYSMRMANTPDELSVPACNMQTPLHTTQNTIFQLRNSDSADPLILQSAQGGDSIVGNNDEKTNKFFTTSPMNCANNLYFLSMKVENSLALSGAGGIIQKITAPIYADWLVGEAWDDVYGEVRPTDEQKLADYNARLLAADEKFLEVYGFRRGEVTTAIMYDMRRVPTDSTENPNYYARSFEELNPNSFLERQNYEIVKSLYDKGLLQFYTPAVTFYLGAEDCVRYWAFPVEGTAKTIITDTDGNKLEYTIKDCNEARFVSVSSMSSDYHLNIAPISNDQKTALQKSMLPTIKMLEGSTSITFPITEIGGSTRIKGVDLSNDNKQGTLSLDNKDIAFIDQQTGEVLNGETALEAGKEYMLRLTLLEENGWEYPDNTETNCRVGYIFINLQIVPQTLVWQPTGNSFNGWGKNENWKGWKDTNSNNQIDEGELVEGFVPMSEANVIIPKLDNALLYPYIVPEHEHSHYPMTVDFQPHHCNNIYFAPEAKIHNQHLLHYEKAFVDMQITAGKWNMMSAPLKKMVSGDMFIPHTGKYNEGGARIAEPDPFDVCGFHGLRHRDAAYLFYQHFYNQTVYSHYEDGGTTSAASIGFEESNSLSQPLQAGSGYSLYGVGLEGKETLTIRLPKPDTVYYYYTSTGVQSTNKTSVDRGENNESYRLAFDAPHDATHENQKMEIPLTNHTATDRFLFGNPTMAYIDMKLFLKTNSAVLNPVFHRIEGSVWTAAADMSMLEDRYLAPMTSVLLETQDNKPRTAITVTLSADHLTLNNTVNTIAEEPENDTRRLIASSPDSPTSELLTIYAFTPKGTARTVLATNPVANDYFVQGEDALFVSSGIENNTSVKSPLNMYTVAEQVPMMADVRQGISQIPLSILADTKVRTDYMQLAFYYTSNWTRECYLVDSYTGQKIRIMNGLIISVEMPQNHEQRYYIEGPDEYLGSSEGGVTTSTSTPSESINYKAWAYSPAAGNLVVSANDMFQRVRIYDMAGRLLTDKALDLLHNTVTMNAPTGVCVVETTMRDGTIIYTQAIVK